MPEISRFYGIIIAMFSKAGKTIHSIKNKTIGIIINHDLSYKKIESAEPYQLRLLFNTGEIKTINLHSKLLEWSESPESKFRDLLDPSFFLSVKLNMEVDTVYWDNGIDLSPEVLYEMAE